MNIEWSDKAQIHMKFWRNVNPKVEKRINNLIENIINSPYSGIGKPEALKHNHYGSWSRRITLEHRLIYCYDEQENSLLIESCKGHYEDK